MISKKGISQAVGFVLIVALTIGLAVFVGSWMKSRSEQTSVDIASELERSTKCDDTTIRAFANCDNICALSDSDCINNDPDGGCHFFDGNEVGCRQNWEICRWDIDLGECLDEDDGASFCGAFGTQDDCVTKLACEWDGDYCVENDEWDGGCDSYNEDQCVIRAGSYIASINFRNKGLFSVVGLKCNGVDVEFNLVPDEEKEEALNNCVRITDVLVVPFVEVSGGETFGCVSKKVILKC